MPALLEKSAALAVERIDNFRDLLREKLEEEREELYRLAGDEDEGVESYSDEAWLLDQLLELSNELVVVALYRVVELHTNRILHSRWREAQIKRLRLYRADKLRAHLEQELGPDFELPRNFKAIDELRLANNAVKHEGSASQQLAKYDGWVEGEPLAGLEELYDRVACRVPRFLRDLASAVNPRLE